MNLSESLGLFKIYYAMPLKGLTLEANTITLTLECEVLCIPMMTKCPLLTTCYGLLSNFHRVLNPQVFPHSRHL